MLGSPPVRDPVFSRPLQPRLHPSGVGRSLRQFRHDAFDRDMSPLLVVDHVQWTRPEPEPHPHAGLSVATVLFEHAQGGFDHVDSLGTRHHLGAGDLHWTLAGRGIVRRTEVSDEPLRIDALQVLVNLPNDLKQQPPASFHLPAETIPVLHAPGSRLRLLAGSLGTCRSPLQLPQPIRMLDGRIDAGSTVRLPLPAGWNAWIYTVSGELALAVDGHGGAAGRSLATATAVTASADLADLTLRLEGIAARSHVVVLAGAAIHEPVVQHGPFVMTTRQDIQRAVEDYEAGRLGVP